MRLEGPLQSWGTQGRFDTRDTDTEPSKSGVLGLVGAAMGVARADLAALAALRGLAFAVRVDREGTLLRDFHTVGGGTFRGDRDYAVWNAGSTAPTKRFYLADAIFTVALGGDDHALVERIDAALASPRWPIFFGRKHCVPSRPPRMGVVDAAVEEAVRTAPLAERAAADRPMRLVLECGAGDGAVPRDDVPLSFELYHRAHARRFVRTAWLSAPTAEREASS